MENLTRFDAEQAVLGAILIDNEAFDKISFLAADEFFAMQHKILFSRIANMIGEGKSVDPTILLGSFNDSDLDSVGGIAYIADIVRNTGTARNVVHYADIVKDMAGRRKAVVSMQQAINKIKDVSESAVGTIAELEDLLDKTIISAADSDILTVDELIEMTMDEMDRSSVNSRTGLSSGIQEIDDRLGYKLLAFGEVTALGALSKNGKTLTANTILARAGYQEGETAHVFSIEMPAIGMFNGIVSAMSGVPNNFYARQDFYHKMYGTDEYTKMVNRWGASAQELNNSNRITIDSKKQVDADYICSNMKKQFAIHRNNGKRLRLVVIDHIHRMEYKTNGQPLTYAIRDAMRKIKNTAAELDIAVVALCQLNNSADGKDPTSFHILDSSSVRHEMQAFIGTRLFRQDGGTFFGIYGDSQRYGDMDTQNTPAYMKLTGGVLRSLGEGEYFTPQQTEETQSNYKR
ncbi:DNA helicase [Vibrio phage 1.091.O._10N.286.52.B12]|nr:DNA helicase [Vibrio phage 1.091.O._10N.286.52.B12]